MSKKIFKFLLIVIGCLYLAPVCMAQIEKPELKNLEGVWMLDSLSVNKIGTDKTEIPVNYKEMTGLDSYIFKKLDFRTDKNCLLFKETEGLPCVYDAIEGREMLLNCENTPLNYRYQLTEYLILAGEFPAGSPDGIIVDCHVFMRFKKQSNK